MLTWKNIMDFVVNGNPKPNVKIHKTNTEWQDELTEEQFLITRCKHTEHPHTGSYCSSFEPGVYDCVCCGTALFDSDLKFESGTGWPSFTQPITANAVKYIKDDSHGMVRVEILCNTCDAHLGHIFPDGPEPSGLRYCVNSISLKKQSNA